MKRLNSAGDTIIEVLLAMTVVSLVLGGAYVSANRSLNNSRQAQERGEALKLAQSQLEAMKSSAGAGNTTIFTYPSTFCMDSSTNVQTSTNPARATTPSLDNDDFASYTPPCSSQGLGQLFYVSTERTSPNQFSVYIRWDRAGGNGRDEVKLVQRLYP